MSDPDTIRAQIEETRRDLGNDVDALADKVSPSQIAERQKEKVRSTFTSAKESVMGGVRPAVDAAKDLASSGSPSDAASSAKQTATGHPIVVGLIAFGAGWLLSSLLPSTRSEQQVVSAAKEKAAPLTEKVKDTAKDAGQEIAQNLKDPAKDAAQSVKESATDAAHTVQDAGRSAAGDVQDTASNAAQAVRSQAADSAEQVRNRS